MGNPSPSYISAVQARLAKYLGVVGNFCFLTIARTYPTVGRFASDPKYLHNNLCTGVKSEHQLSLLRFIQRVPRNLTFTNKPRRLYLFYFHSLRIPIPDTLMRSSPLCKHTYTVE